MYGHYDGREGPSGPFDIDAVEEWSDARGDAGQKLLDEERRYQEAFRLLSTAADALDECGPEIVDMHTQAGVEAGNTDPHGLRNTWLNTNHAMPANDYHSAADAALKLHDRLSWRKMIMLENAAYRKRAERLTIDLAKDLRHCG